MMCVERKIGSVGLQGMPTIRARMGNELSNAIPTELMAASKLLQVLSGGAYETTETILFELDPNHEGLGILCSN